MAINLSNIPAVFGEKGRNPKMVGLDALKDSHVSFNGYGIAEDEVITFPTVDEVNANPKKFIKQLDSRVGSKNKSVLMLVDRNGRTSWFNLSVLSRNAVDQEGNRVDIDDFRTEMRAMNDDFERFQYLAGKSIKGTGTIDGYAPKFVDGQPVRDENGKLETVEAKYVTIEVVE